MGRSFYKLPSSSIPFHLMSLLSTVDLNIPVASVDSVYIVLIDVLATQLCMSEAWSAPEQQPTQLSEQSGHSDIGWPSPISRNNQSRAGVRATHTNPLRSWALLQCLVSGVCLTLSHTLIVYSLCSYHIEKQLSSPFPPQSWELNVALPLVPTVPHMSAALATPTQYIAAQCSHSDQVLEPTQACVVGSNIALSSSV